MALATVVALALTGMIPGCGGDPGAQAFEEGLRQIEQGHYARAKVLLEKSITRRPTSDENARAHNYLGLASSRLGQLDQAIKAFEESIRLDPGYFEPSYNLAVLMHRVGKVQRARQLLHETSVHHGNDTRALEFLAHTYLEEEAWSSARDILERVLEQAPGSPSALTSMGLAAGGLEGPEARVAYLMRALEQSPDYAPALFDLALTYERELNDPDKAVTFYGRFLAVAKEGGEREYARKAYENLLLSGSGPDESDDALAVPQEEDVPNPVTSSEKRSYDELLADARTAAAAGRVKDALAWTLEAAERAKQRRDHADTERALKTALELCPTEEDAFITWGQYCIDRARYDQAIRAFRSALALNPRRSESLLGMAEAATEAHEYDAALVTLKQALRIDAENQDALWSLATLYDEHLSNDEKAALAYRTFARRFPDDPRIVRAQERLERLEKETAPPPAPEPVRPEPEPEPRPAATKPAPAADTGGGLGIRPAAKRDTGTAIEAYNRATRHQEKGEWDKAIFNYRRAIENDPSFALAYYNLGTAYKATGETNLSKEAYLHAVQIQPEMLNARYNLALLYMELGSHSAAIEQLRTVARLRPDHAPTHYALGMLYARNRQALDLAKKHYRKFLELAPNDAAAAEAKRWLDAH
jgi:superkiller protein 3